jgi:hypothetical protein
MQSDLRDTACSDGDKIFCLWILLRMFGTQGNAHPATSKAVTNALKRFERLVQVHFLLVNTHFDISTTSRSFVGFEQDIGRHSTHNEGTWSFIDQIDLNWSFHVLRIDENSWKNSVKKKQINFVFQNDFN